MYDKNTQSNEKYFSTCPGKQHHTKHRDCKEYQCFCNKLFDFVHSEGLAMSKCDVQCTSKQRKNYIDSVEKATQMNKKDIYDGCILEGLLNTNTDLNKTYVKVDNSESIISNYESLTDIKKILVTTNNKLDLILKKLSERYSLKHKEQIKQQKLKSNKLKSKTTSSLMIPSQNGLIDLPNLMQIQSNCESTTRIAKLKPKQCPSAHSFYLAPYNSCCMYGTNMNCFKKFGTKCLEKSPSNVWNPFIFMATNIDARQIRLENGGDKTPHNNYDRSSSLEMMDKVPFNYHASIEQLIGDQD